MTLYEKFLRLHLDLTPLGLLPPEDAEFYFCTPRGAHILGRAGVDGIHYCFVRGFGEMVFAVNPTNAPGDYVHPIARSFADLMRLLLACGGLDAAEQAHLWQNETAFRRYLSENPPDAGQRALLQRLQEALDLTPMDAPFAYIRNLQRTFDYNSIPYRPEYYELNPASPAPVPEWKVTFNASFHRPAGRAGRETAIQKRFDWGGETWHIPAVYLCGKGLVVDLCAEVDPEKMRAFIRRWDLLHEPEGGYTEEQTRQIESENPLDPRFSASVFVNGRELTFDHSSSLCWIAPDCLDDVQENNAQAAAVLEHYGLDPSRCWSFHRCAFLWATRRPSSLCSLALQLQRDPVELPGPRFRVPEEGGVFPFVHPVTGVSHVLTAHRCVRQQVDPQRLQDEELLFPTHYAVLQYELSPDLAPEDYFVRDCAPSDAPRRRDGGAAGCGGVIGIARGGSQEALHTVCSSLHFDPAPLPEWQIFFRQKQVPDATFPLL